MKTDAKQKYMLNGLRGRFLALFTALAVATGASALVISMKIAGNALEKGLSEKASAMARSLASASADGILSGDSGLLERLVNRVSQEPDIQFVSINRMDGTVLVQKTTGPGYSNFSVPSGADSPAKSDGRKITIQGTGDVYLAVEMIRGPARGSSEAPLGQVRIGLATNSVSASLREILFEGLLLLSLVIVAGIGAAVISLRPFFGSIGRRDASRIETEGNVVPVERGVNTPEDAIAERELGTLIRNGRTACGDVMRAAETIDEDSKRLMEAVEIGNGAEERAVLSIEHMNDSFKEIGSGVTELSSSVEMASSSVLELSASIGEVAGSTSGLSAAVDDTSSSIIEMASSIKQVADHAGALSAASQDTASAIREISASVKEVENRAKESARVSEKVTLDAEELGVKSIEKTIEGMARIKSSIDQATAVVDSLGSRSEHIGKVLTVIEEVTKQTNLLALNAAILAAQAGEHGKGFSVVAGEIKKLSNRTTASTNEIVEMISAIQKDAKDAVAVIRDGASNADVGMRLSAEAGNALKKLLDGARRSTAMALAIEGTTVEQAKGIQQVTEAVERVSVMSQQIEKATQEQRKGAELIMSTSERMRDITRQVRIATEEQAKGSRQITGEVESVTEKVQVIARALAELRKESEMIGGAIEEIRDASKHSAEISGAIAGVIGVLSNRARSFEEELSANEVRR